MSYDPHRDSSLVLTEVRTVLKRARTALVKIEEGGFVSERDGKPIWPEYQPHPGDDVEAVRAALRRVVEELSRWERTR